MYAQFVLLILFSTLTLTVSVSFATSVDDAHSIVTNKMLQSAQNAAMGVSNAPPINGTTIPPLYIPIIFSAVGNDSLVVGIDIQEFVYGNNYTEQDVRDYLDVDVPLEIMYMGFDHISNSYDNISFDLLADECYPEVEEVFADQCSDLFAQLSQERNNNTETLKVSSSSAQNPCDVSSGSVICYYYNRFIDRCIPTYTASRCHTYATIIINNGYSLPTSTTTTDTTPPVITVPSPITVQTQDSTGTTVRYTVSASDHRDGAITPSCTPASGSLFSIGITTVTCTARDTSGNIASEQFIVTVTHTASGSTLFSDNFENGLEKWIEKGEQDWRSSTLDHNVVIPGHSSSNIVAQADNCDSDCILEMRNSIDLSRTSSRTLEFYRFVDSALDRGEYLKVEGYDGRSWNQLAIYGADSSTDDGSWHRHTLEIPYTNSDFKIRFIAHASKSSEEVAVDGVFIRAVVSSTNSLASGIFSDNFESGLDKWIKRGEQDWRTGTSDDGVVITGRTISNNIAEADNCDSECILEMRHGVDLSHTPLASLEFYRYADRGLDYGEYLKVEVYDGESWIPLETYGPEDGTDDGVWNKESIYLSGYSNSDFKIRFIGHASKSYEDIAVDEVLLRAVTSSPFSITILNTTTTAHNESGGYLNYTVKVSSTDGNVTVTCSQESGNFIWDFFITIYCFFTDSSGNKQHIGFEATVESVEKVYGGNTLLYAPLNNARADDNIRVERSTITIGAISSGVKGIVVSGHGVDISTNNFNERYYKQINESVRPSDNILLSTDEGRGKECGKYDAAFIPITNNKVIAPLNQIQKQNGEIFNVTQGNLSDVPYESDIWMYNKHTEGMGTLLYKYATIRTDTFCVNTNLGLINHTVEVGDSGTPIVYHDGDNSLLIGSVTARACGITLPLESRYGIEPNSYTNICSNSEFVQRHGGTDFVVFSAWENIKDETNGLNID